MAQHDGFAIGVDVGTSNTVAVLRWPDGRTRPLLHDGAPVMPSGVLVDQAGRLHVGRDAQRMAQLDPAHFEPNPKRRIDESAVLLGEREVPVVDLLAALLAAVARAAVEVVGFLPPAALTYPAAWGQPRRDVLTAAAARAGWPPVLLVPEPVAAARYFAGVLRRPVPVGVSLAVFDFGGGTLDIAVVRNAGNGFTVLGSGGVPDLGGLDIDAAVVDHLGAMLGGSVPGIWRALAHPATATERRDRRLLWDDVRGAKEMLSRTAVAPVAVPGLDRAVHLTRDELERVAAPLLHRGVHETAAVIRRCGLRPDELAGLFLVGGSSRLPLVSRMLHAELGIAPAVLEQPELPVAEGALPAASVHTTGYPVEAAPTGSGALFAASAVPVAVSSPSSAPPGSPGSPVSSGPAGSAVGAARVPPAPVSAAPGPPGQVSPPYPPGVGGPTQPPGPGGRPWYRRPVTWIAAAASVVVVVLVATVVLVLRDDVTPVEFGTLRQVGSGIPMQPGAGETFTTTLGARSYVGYTKEKKLWLGAVDTGTGKQVWPVREVGTADGWERVVALPNAVVAVANRYSGDKPRTAFALDPDSGRPAWQADLHSDDDLLYYDKIVVLVSPREHVARGLDLGSGKEKWKIDFPRNEYGGQRAKVLDVGTARDLRGPAGLDGRAAAPDRRDDHRLLLIGDDKTLRVYDAATGAKSGKDRPGVGDTDDVYLGHAGRLYVAAAEQPYQIRAYDLDKAGEPRVVYTAADEKRRLTRLAPCGEDRLCGLDSASSDAKTAQVLAIDVAGGGQAWRKSAPEADTITPVGDRILASSASGTPSSMLFDAGGRQLLKAEDRPGVAVRVNGASLLVFSAAPTSYPTVLGLVGVDAADGRRTAIGTLDKVHGKSCSWNEQSVVCPTEKDFRVWRFAAD